MIGLAFVLAWTSRYGILESFTKVLVILMVVAFVATAIGSQPNMSDLVCPRASPSRFLMVTTC